MSPSGLKAISFENYRAFKAKQKINIRPITLLFGYNNSGKSAALRLVPLIAASFDGVHKPTYTKSILNYSSPCIRTATFNEIVHGNATKLWIGLEWDDGVSFECELRQEGLDPEGFEYIDLNVPAKKYKARFIPNINSSGSKNYVLENSTNDKELVHLDGFKFTDAPADIVSEIKSHQSELATSVHWITSLRVHPPREFDIGAGVEVGVKFNGEGTAQTIWHLSENNSEAFDLINNWLEDTCGRRIDVSTSTSTAKSNGKRTVKLETVSVINEQPNSGSIRVPILDSGEGIAQALPVVTICAQATLGDLGEYPIVAIEQPELHLHPKSTVDLANYLINCSNKNKNVRFVIETHSESLLLALQTAIVEGKLLPEEVSCYWVKPDLLNGGSKITEIAIDDEGFVSDEWPEAVFEETFYQARELIKKRENKKGN